MGKTSISVPEMQRLLGMKKVEAYWLVKQDRFQTILVGGKMRVLLDSFEDWYSGQFHYKKVNGPPPGQKWEHTLGIQETAQRLGIHPGTVYTYIKRGQLRAVKVDNRTRIYKDSFANQQALEQYEPEGGTA